MTVEMPLYGFKLKKDCAPDILKIPFTEGINPYTMIFLFESYSRDLYKKLSNAQRNLFDKYYTTNFLLSDIPSKTERKALVNLIKNGFTHLRDRFPSEYIQYFPETRLPFFKLHDRLVIDADERRRHTCANRSLGSKGKTISKEHRQKLSASVRLTTSDEQYRERLSKSAKTRWKDPEYRRKMAKRDESCSDKKRQKLSESARSRWKDPEYRRKMTSKEYTDQHKKKQGESMKIKWQDPEYREKILGALVKGRETARRNRLAKKSK